MKELKTKSQKSKQRRTPSFLERAISGWADRLLGVVNDRSFHSRGEQYAPNQAKRDFLWNSIGMGVWGCVFPVLTIVVTQLSGVQLAGMFSMAFVVANLLMILANFGIRTFQVSDIKEHYSFADYCCNRVITCLGALFVGYLYCCTHAYESSMTIITMGVVTYKALDGFADVYEGRLQQMGKMYLSGISIIVRSVLVFVAFCLALFVTRSLPIACVACAVMALLSVIFFTLPLAHMETPKSSSVSFAAVVDLFKQSWPLFMALFVYALADNMPKFVMEGELSYDNQLYYNALYFPAMYILMTVQAVYKPLLLSMVKVWNNKEKRLRFDLIILAVVAFIVLLTAVVAGLMTWIGLDIMSFLYGIDFQQFRSICLIMLVAGGVASATDFLYQTITILRRQKDVIVAYIITLVLSLFVPLLLIHYAQLQGAVVGYLIVMSVLFMLMLWLYFRIRFTDKGNVQLDYENSSAQINDQTNEYGNVQKSSHVNVPANEQINAPIGAQSRQHAKEQTTAYISAQSRKHTNEQTNVQKKGRIKRRAVRPDRLINWCNNK